MLSMLLLLAGAPQGVVASAPSLRPATIQEMIDAGAMPPPLPPYRDGDFARMPVLGEGGLGCASMATQTRDPTSSGNGLLWREGGEAVGLYRLLDRRMNGCPEPIIVNYRVPGSNAVGREVGRDPAALPVFVRRP